MNIRSDTAGKVPLEGPQQRRNSGRGGDPACMQVASFAGHEMMEITDDKGGYDLHFLGFMEGPHPTMDHAKAAAPKFALAVLDVMKSKIVS